MRSLLPALLLPMLLSSCGEGDASVRSTAKGGRHYGGIFNWNETGTVRSIHPLGLTTTAGFRIGSLVYQGLLRFDPGDLSIRPCLAERWEVDSSGTVYTFHLRSDVRFPADPLLANGEGRALTASDVEECFRRLCTASPDNHMFWLFQDRVLGAEEHYNATAAGGSLNDAVKVTVFLTDLAHFGRVNEIMATYFQQPYPARAAIGVAALPRGARVEMECVLSL